ncbi:tyrosine-protein phosphatase non-receptor type 23, partial [Plakobranchus ocellatus]
NEVTEVHDCLQFAKDVILGKYESAKKDNDFVYHDKVPDLASLPEVKGASLVKGIPFDPTDKEISGPDIFQKLVPMEAHEASSVYSEEKAKLSRNVVGEIEEKDMELQQFLSSLQLDEDQLMPRPDIIPEQLMEKCAAMSVRVNAIKELTDSMASVSGLATEVDLGLQEIQELVDTDTQKTQEFEEQYGNKKPSSVLPRLLEELTNLRKRHEEGSQLNNTLHKAMNTHTTNLKTLALAPSEIQAMLPSSQPTLSPEDDNVVSEVRRLMQKVSEMKEQRKALLEQFRGQIHGDDITSVLLTQDKTNKEAVFAEQLKKHDQLVGYIKQNLAAQDNILRALTDANAKFAAIRQAYTEAAAKREKTVQELIASYDKYEELLAKSKKGTEYYKKLSESVAKTLERCQGECKIRREEREMLLARFAPRVAPPSRPQAPKPGTGTPTNTGVPPSFPPGLIPGQEDTAGPLPPGPLPSTSLPSQPQNLPPSFEGPKLKDYLPFMKPRSFGLKSGDENPPAAAPSVPPPTPPVSEAGFDLSSGNYQPNFPGLDPSLASILPATIAQYLASVSQGQTSVPGGRKIGGGAGPGRPSPSASPQHGRVAAPARHSPSPNLSAASNNLPQQMPISAHPQPASQFQQHPTRMLQASGGPVQPLPSQLSQGGSMPSVQGQVPPVNASYPQQNVYGTNLRQGPLPSGISSSAQSPLPSGMSTGTQYPSASSPSMMMGGAMPGSFAQQQVPPLISQAPQQPAPSQGQHLPQTQQPFQQPQYGNMQGSHHLQQQTNTDQAITAKVGPGVSGDSMPQQHQQHQVPQQHQQPGNQLPQPQQNQGFQQQQQLQPQYAQTPQYQQPQLHQTLAQQPHQTNPQQQQQQQQPVRYPTPQQWGAQYPASAGTTSLQHHQYGQQAHQQPPKQGPLQPQQNFQPEPQFQDQGGQTVQPLPQQQGPQSHLYQGQMQPAGQPQALPQHPQQQQQQHHHPQQHHQQQGGPAHTYQPTNQSYRPQAPVTSSGYRYTDSNYGAHGNISNFSYQQNQQRYLPQFSAQQSSPRFPQPSTTSSSSVNHLATTSVLAANPQYASSYPSSQPAGGSFMSTPVMTGQSGQGVSTLSVHSSPHGAGMTFSGQWGQLAGQGKNPAAGPAQGVQGQPGQHQYPVPGGGGGGSIMSALSAPHMTGASFNQANQQGYLPSHMQPQQQLQHPQQGPYQQQQPKQQSYQPQQLQPQQQQQQHQQYQQHQSQQLQQQPYQQQPYQQQQQPYRQQQQLQPGFGAAGSSVSGPSPLQRQQQLPHDAQGSGGAGGSGFMTAGMGMMQHQPQQQLHHQQQPQHSAGQMNPQQMQGLAQTQHVALQTPLQPVSVSRDAGLPKPALTPGNNLSGPNPLVSSAQPVAPMTAPSSPIPSRMTVSRQSSSLDEILSSSPNGMKGSIITPQVLTDQERQLQKEEAMKKQAIPPDTAQSAYSGPGEITRLLADVEAFGKFVDELSVPILGVSRLDTVWKSLLDSQDATTKKMSMAIARCYPMKNRDPDIMPYDETRVVLTSSSDDYINASWMNDLAPSCPKFIVTQSPLTLTTGEFWSMVYEQGSEVLVQITSEYETGKKYPVYYPVDKDKPQEQGPMLLSLQSVKFRQHWVERIIYMKNNQTKQGRTVVHLQFKNWPVSGFPDEVSSIVNFISEVHSFYLQQRSLTKPIIVHCGTGIGRTGVFTLVYAAMQEILHGNGLVDIPGLARRMLQKRRSVLHKKEQLQCCYQALLQFAEGFLEKRNVLVKNPHKGSFHQGSCLSKSSPKHHTPSPAPDDIVLGSVDLQTIRENVGRLHVSQPHSPHPQNLAQPGFPVDSGSCDGSLSSGLASENSQQGQLFMSDTAIGKHKRNNSSGLISPSPQPSLSSLPDVVQQYGSDLGQNNSVADPTTGMSVYSSATTDKSRVEPFLLESVNGNSADVKMEDPASMKGGSVTLSQLQDPKTFTLGSPDEKKKNKITKANFAQAQGALQSGMGSQDPSDPLGSLDPLWSLAKK